MDSDKFSQHAFTIRERVPREISDLAFIILRHKWRSLIFYFMILAVPCFLLNLLVFYPFFLSVYDPIHFYPGSIGFFLVTIGVMSLESDFVGSLLTLWLGEWFFRPHEKIPVRFIFQTWFSLLPQIFYYLVFFRIFYIFFPFVNNILLLEKPPFFKMKGKITTSQRISQFRKGGGQEIASGMISLFSRFLVLYLLGGIIIFFWGKGFIGANEIWYPLFFLIVFPIYFWIFILYDVVYTFLAYLNVRIIREGWAVDIAFKAEFLHHSETEELIPFSQPDLDFNSGKDLSDPSHFSNAQEREGR